MNKYESVLIINPTVEDEKLKELEKTFTDMINEDGKVEKVEELGKKKLAYTVKKNVEGMYITFYFDANPALIEELERNFRITDEILKFIVIRVDE